MNTPPKVTIETIKKYSAKINNARGESKGECILREGELITFDTDLTRRSYKFQSVEEARVALELLTAWIADVDCNLWLESEANKESVPPVPNGLNTEIF